MTLYLVSGVDTGPGLHQDVHNLQLPGKGSEGDGGEDHAHVGDQPGGTNAGPVPQEHLHSGGIPLLHSKAEGRGSALRWKENWNLQSLKDTLIRTPISILITVPIRTLIRILYSIVLIRTPIMTLVRTLIRS